MIVFSPQGDTANLTVTASSQAVALNKTTGEEGTARVHNSDTTDTFVAFGISTVSVTAAAGIPLAPGETAFIDLGPGVTHMAAIGSANTKKVYVTWGKVR
jgi:hypothetical protein